MTIVFDDTITGHHLEYLSHYHALAGRKREEQFLFLLPKEFEKEKHTINWTDEENITVRYISDSDMAKCKNTNVFVAAWRKSRLVANEARKENAGRVILTTLIEFMPFLLFLIPSNCILSGIIYRIYLRDNNMSGIRLWLEKLRFFLMARIHKKSILYILNDKKSVCTLNKEYNTTKFKFLPDPVPNIDISSVRSIREKLGIQDSGYVYLHFGGLTERKGTLEILKAIMITDEKTLSNKSFVFAGKVYDDIREEFYNLLEQAKQRTNILVFDEFCQYDFLYNLCKTCDCILIPYKMTNLSSGILGYAALFNKPVIAPEQGLIGDIVRENSLGITLRDVSASGISAAFNIYPESIINNYVTENSVDNFINTLA